jgi:hypothetical protein
MGWDVSASFLPVLELGRVDAALPEQTVDLGLDPVVILLRLRRPPEEQARETSRLPHQLQELRLPVLEGGREEMGPEL